MPLLLPRSYSTGKVVRIPVELKTVGDHIRRKRLQVRMLQKDVANKSACNRPVIRNWEANSSTPHVRYMAAIIQFLGHNPLPEEEGWGKRLVRRRTTLGLSQKETARRLGVDPSTLAKWERGEREPAGRFLERVKRFLNNEQTQQYTPGRLERTDSAGPQLDSCNRAPFSPG